MSLDKTMDAEDVINNWSDFTSAKIEFSDDTNNTPAVKSLEKKK